MLTRLRDNLWTLPVGLGALAFLLVASTLDDPGITWDEAFVNIPAARGQAEWMARLSELDRPFSKETIDTYWETTSDHPSLARTCAAVSYLLFQGWVGETASLRLPSAIWFGLLVTGVAVSAAVLGGRWAGLVAGLALMSMPRLFGHAHVFSLDIPITALWFFAGVAFLWSLRHPRGAPWAAAVYALAFATKLHAVFLPPLFGAMALTAWYRRSEERPVVFRSVLIWAGAAVILVPIVYVGTQPWLWHDTWPRIVERFGDYAAKSTARPIPVWFLGERYGNDTPWSYPLVLTALTVPTVTLTLFLAGLVRLIRSQSEPDGWAWTVLLAGGWAIPLSLVLLPLSQAYDGVRLFLPGFPFLAVISGLGAAEVGGRLRDFFEPRLGTESEGKLRLLAGLGVILFLAGPVVAIARLHPCQLAYYNALAGGLPGAQRMGLESTFWCDALTPPFLERINKRIPEGASLKALAMPDELLAHYQQRGLLRSDIRFGGDIPVYDFHLLQCRQGMFVTAEWWLYGNQRPLEVVERDGVMLYALYGRLPR